VRQCGPGGATCGAIGAALTAYATIVSAFWSCTLIGTSEVYVRRRADSVERIVATVIALAVPLGGLARMALSRVRRLAQSVIAMMRWLFRLSRASCR